MRPRTVVLLALGAAACLAGCGAPLPSWVMPDLVGRDLQSAQEAVQELTDYAIAATVAHDATGARRPQVVDREWTVCTQSAPAGSRIDPDTMIDFGVVPRGEAC